MSNHYEDIEKLEKIGNFFNVKYAGQGCNEFKRFYFSIKSLSIPSFQREIILSFPTKIHHWSDYFVPRTESTIESEWGKMKGNRDILTKT